MTQHAHSDRHRGTHGQPVHSITDADEARSAEQHSRIVKYTVSMAVRLACFIGAFFTSGPLQWALLAGAVVLPYFAVIIANGGADRSKRVHSEALLDAPPRWALGAARDAGAQNAGAAGSTSGEGDASGAGATAEPDAGPSPGGNGTGGTGGPGTDGTSPVLLEGELVEDGQQDGSQATPPGASEGSAPSGTANASKTANASRTAQGRP